MRKFLVASFMCFAILVPSVMFAQDGDKKKEDTKKEEKKECKDDSCKKPAKEK